MHAMSLLHLGCKLADLHLLAITLHNLFLQRVQTEVCNLAAQRLQVGVMSKPGWCWD